MFRTAISLSFLCLIGVALTAEKNESEEVCFEKLGCFPTGYPWVQQLRPLPPPVDPKQYNANLVFYSREVNGSHIPLYPAINFQEVYHANRYPSIFILPDSGGQLISQYSWVLELKEVLLERIECNVFVFNASAGIEGVNAFIAAANLPVFAKQVSLFIDSLKKDYHLKHDTIWIIGYGSGAHLAGLIGSNTRIGRITGLDPQQQLFETFETEVRLDPSDADFVDCIHSDSRPIIPDIGVGFMETLADIDFYANGGFQQPGCKLPRPFDLLGVTNFFELLSEIARLLTQSFLCSHKFAHRIFIESIRNQKCTFWGHAGTYENMLRAISNAGSEGILSKYTALLNDCDMSKCVPVGLATSQTSLRGIFIVTTTPNAPYCIDNKDKVDQQIFYQMQGRVEDWFKSFWQGNAEHSNINWPFQ